MKAFLTKWDKSEGYNKCGSDATQIVTGMGSLIRFYQRLEREAGNGIVRAEVFWNDKVYGKPDAVEYIVDGRIMGYRERQMYEARLPIEQLVMG